MVKKFNLVFDATILSNGVNKNAGRSGIFFAVHNIFSELQSRPDIDLKLYYDGINCNNLRLYLRENYKDKKFNIITQGGIYKTLERKLFYSRKNKNYFKIIILQILLCIMFPVCECLLKLQKKDYISKINNNDAYLSLVFKKPDGVKIKSYIMLYDLIPLFFPEYHNMHWNKDNWLYNLCASLNSDDYYFAISNSTKKDFLEHYTCIDKNKIQTIYLACNNQFNKKTNQEITFAKKKYNIPLDKKYIFSLCTLEPRKNLIRTIRTFIKFINKNNIQDIIFVLGGGHWDIFIKKIEEEITNLAEYKNKIIKIGYVDDEDLPALYSGAEWFTYTSMYEGFGLPPLEAMSCGCPVITSNNSSLPEVIGDAGIMIDYNSDIQHIQAYERYYYDLEFRNAMIQKGLNRAKQFSWEKCVNEILKTMRNPE